MALCNEGTTRLKLGPVMTPDGVPYAMRLDGLCSQRGNTNTYSASSLQARRPTYDVVIGGRCCSTNLPAHLHAQDIIRTCIWIRIPQGHTNESHGL
jgi:hypothetical protein